MLVEKNRVIIFAVFWRDESKNSAVPCSVLNRIIHAFIDCVFILKLLIGQARSTQVFSSRIVPVYTDL